VPPYSRHQTQSKGDRSAGFTQGQLFIIGAFLLFYSLCAKNL
jgi:hypothetical protein